MKSKFNVTPLPAKSRKDCLWLINENRFSTSPLSILSQPYHLYITNLDPIRKGDWYILVPEDKIMKAEKGIFTNSRDFIKIVATTDPYIGLPIIPNSFIEHYCKKTIDEVELVHMVETVVIGTSEFDFEECDIHIPAIDGTGNCIIVESWKKDVVTK